MGLRSGAREDHDPCSELFFVEKSCLRLCCCERIRGSCVSNKRKQLSDVTKGSEFLHQVMNTKVRNLFLPCSLPLRMTGPRGRQHCQLAPNQENSLEALDHLHNRGPAFTANAGVQRVLFSTMFNGGVKG